VLSKVRSQHLQILIYFDFQNRQPAFKGLQKFCLWLELVAKGLLTRTELIDAIAVGHPRQGLFSSVTFVGYQINGISGHSFLRWRYSAPFVFVSIEPMVKKQELKLLPHFLML
jgi:hypothetical protein